jgi:TonB family protein
MSLHPPLRPDAGKATPSRDNGSSSGVADSCARSTFSEVSAVAKKLAAHGSGAVSFDLALDLVLNDIVEQARDATGATGAAIALARDGEIVCRATTGGNAPDLGVRVETASGLAGECVRTGQVQQCSDTEVDPRVNPEVCRLLGVRSMLIVPVVDNSGPCGILEVFSTQPRAFGERGVETLQRLAQTIAANQKQPEDDPLVSLEPQDRSSDDVSERLSALQEQSLPPEGESSSGAKSGRNEIWTSALVALVIATAVALGIVIAGPRALKGRRSGPQVAPVTPARRNSPAAVRPGSSAPGEVRVPGGTVSSEPPNGGLIVTQNGKVIYRQSPSESISVDSSSEPSARHLIHRVEPEYPAEAREQHIQGSVVLNVQVMDDGSVGNIEIVSGDPSLADATVRAVKQWKYQPNIVNGVPAQSLTRITVKFTLPVS